MKKLLFLFLLLPTLSDAQVNLDSLWSVWYDEDQADTNRLKAMAEISWEGYLFTQPDSAFYFSQLQLNFAKEKGQNTHIANALNTQGASFFLQGDYDKAMVYYTESLKIEEEIGNKIGIASSLNNIGSIYQDQGNYDKAIDYYMKSLKIEEEIGNKSGMATSLYNIGSIYQDQSDYDKAIDYFTESLKIEEGIGNKSEIASSLTNIGLIYNDQGDYNKAIEYYTKSLKIEEEVGNKSGIAFSLTNIGLIYNDQGDYDKAIDYYTKSLKIEEEIGNKRGIATSLNNIGGIYNDQSDYDKAMVYYTESLKIEEEIGNKIGIANSLNNIGSIYQDQGDYDKAMLYYMKSLKVEEEIGNKSGIATSLNNIGLIYNDQGVYDKAIDYFSKSLKIEEEIGGKRGIATSLNNIGLIYNDQGDYDKAIDYYTKSLKIEEEIGNKSGIASSLNNIGSIYNDQGDYGNAMDYVKRSLAIAQEIGNKSGISTSLYNIGLIYNDQGDYNEALDYGKRSLAIAQEIGFAATTRDAAQLLWGVNKDLDRSKESLEMYELYIATRDSLASEDNQKAIIQQEYKYAYEKKAAADSVKAAESGKVKDALLMAQKAENKQHQQQQYFLYAGLALALLFGGFIFNRFKLANKQKAIIEQQKQIVDKAYDGLEEAHKEITDSMNYAERIQRSFLANDELLNLHLKEYFVYFNPKEVVSGDFYWAGKLNNGHFAILNADSTGHGVPGAIMSILNISAIEKAVEKNVVNPADIFDQTRKTIIERLKKDGSDKGGKDGMDASMISFNTDKTKMSYVAAQNPIWIIRNGELTVIKPEKMPVGKHDNDHIPFNGGEYDIQKGDQIYTLTDGFQDQFGGPKGKKFMVKKMREYVLSISSLTMAEQHQSLTEVFLNWKGELEQVDDVCVIGVKI